tara:strand:+ start:605 stop:775 length:171 start_codon:yes stop_codon:yes gene_type:complete
VNLGQCLQYGVGEEKDEKQARQLYEKAARVHNAEGLFCLAFCHEVDTRGIPNMNDF